MTQQPPVRTMRTAAVLLAAQAAATAAITVYLVYADLARNPVDRNIAWSVTGFALVGAVFLGGLARGVARHRRWARDLSVALQLVLLAPAYYQLTGPQPVIGVLVGGVCLAIIGLLVAPPSNRAIGVRAAG